MIHGVANPPEGARKSIPRIPAELRWNVLDALHFLLRWKRLIVWNTLLWSAAAIITVLVIPKTYRGETVLMPPEDRSEGLSKMMRQLPMSKLGGGASLISGLQGGKDLENIYLAILTSRSLRMEMVKSFDLAKLYKFDGKKKWYIEDL
ncbi:MAG TPA: Wzz/FepE/Etk N-terminal domain-containing protein, partial [Fibrobacteria bacterium]|nr:Wzz/FepE/Etk N-terminal domain-containing protein [Fibrobacteria bacterium]